jgi:hypothetical protein
MFAAREREAAVLTGWVPAARVLGARGFGVRGLGTGGLGAGGFGPSGLGVHEFDGGELAFREVSARVQAD